MLISAVSWDDRSILKDRAPIPILCCNFIIFKLLINSLFGVFKQDILLSDLERRNIDVKERLYLREKGVVTEMQADLG